MKRFLLIFLILQLSLIFANDKQDIPTDFFMGKWGGTIWGELIDKQPHHPPKIYPFNLELVGRKAKYGIGPFGGGAPAWMRMDATWPGKFTLVVDTVACLVSFGPNYPILTIGYPVSDPATIAEIAYSTAFSLAGFTLQIENKDKTCLASGGADSDIWEDSWAKGELYRIYTKKDILGKTIQINEQIKTDNFTQREIVILNKGEVIVSTNSDCVFTSESKLNLIMGEIKISGPTKVKTPQAVCGVRGTQFITKVKDGTTTLTVLDGEVEFSDIQKRKTVVVKKNQRSVCKLGGLPTEPETINPTHIPKWWE